MESANIQHHHLHQDQLVGSSSSSSSSTTIITPTSSNYYGIAPAAASHLAWIPCSVLNTDNSFNSYPSSDTNLSSREISVPYSSMAPDLGFQWANATANFTGINSNHQYANEIKEEELSSNYYLNNNMHVTKNIQENDLSTKLLLKSLSSGNLMNKIHELSPSENHHHNSLYSNSSPFGRGFSQIHPSINVPNMNHQLGSEANTVSGGFDMNLEALDDLLASHSRIGPGLSFSSPSDSHNQMGFSCESSFDHVQQSNQMPSFTSSNKISGPSRKVVETKRTSSKMEPKAIQSSTAAAKKSRLEARASCPPFKVRKEKLGDRIAALQQLVAPFGKTDTASVLMEAIGYIKFLQDQVETLSVPYMKASRNKTTRVVKGVASEHENHEESKRDLKSRGLCLVPLSCLSYITDGGGGAVWPPPHFGGAT